MPHASEHNEPKMNINSNLSGKQQFSSWCIEKKTFLQNAKNVQVWVLQINGRTWNNSLMRVVLVPGNLFQESVVKTHISMR